MAHAVDFKQSRIICLCGVCDCSTKLLKTNLHFCKTVPTLNCHSPRRELHRVADRNNNRQMLPHGPLRPDDLKISESLQSFTIKRDNRKEFLYTPARLENYPQTSGTRYGLSGNTDTQEILKECYLPQVNMRKMYERCHYSESEKYDFGIVSGNSYQIRHCLRARSESEPISIQHLQNLPLSNRDGPQLNDCKNKQSDIVRGKTDHRKKTHNARILVYNNSPRGSSQAQLKKVLSHHAAPVLGSPRFNRVTRNKMKLSSSHVAPTFAHTIQTPNRKPKSILTTAKQAIEIKNKRLSSGFEMPLTRTSDSEVSVEENGDDRVAQDSEIAVKTHLYPQHKSSSLNVQDNLLKGQQTVRFVTSLFPNVPPYLSFCSHIEKRPPMQPCLNKILKWKLTTVMPKLIRCILMNSGFRLLKKTNDWMGTWGKHMKSPCFKTVRSYQKFNHIPGSFKIGRKDACWRNLQAKILKHGSKEFGFMPKTYIMPQDLKLLRRSWPKYAQRNSKWIVKPPASARGTGIKVINRWSQIPKRKPVIVQRYIDRPYLINGSKFDLRLYVLVTSINPLRVYIYQDGLVRFASVKYSEKPDTLNDRCMHLTNYSINKLSSTYSRNEDINACRGHKWTIKSLWSYFQGRDINTSKLWCALCNLVLRTLLAGENSLNNMFKINVESKYNCFELFGFDVLLDSELVPWLLEVNISPSLNSELPLDLHVKGPLVQAVLNTALYHVPPKLSPEQEKLVLCQEGLPGPLCNDKRIYITYLSRDEKAKHNYYTKKFIENRTEYLNCILDDLTPDDLRCLIVSEDELQRSSPLERIFPTPTTQKYLKYTEVPRYYNLLLDAWEQKYHRNRLEGINILQVLCKRNLHLEVPTQPVTKGIWRGLRCLYWRFRAIHCRKFGSGT